MSNYDGFIKFINRYKATNTGDKKMEYSHTAMGPPYGSYCVPNDKLKIFTKLYLKALNEGHNLHMVERPMEVGPLIIDIDWNTSLKNKERLYKYKDIEYIIKKTNELIRKYYNIEDTSKFKVLITEKPKPTVERKKNKDGKIVGKVKDGFHVYYPHLPISSDMRELILKELAYIVKKEKPFPHIPYTNPETDVIDPRVAISNGIVMYGSVKPKKYNGQYYKLTYVVNYRLKRCKLDNFTDSLIVRLISNRRYWDTDPLKIRETFTEKDIIKAKKAVGIKVASFEEISIDTESEEYSSSDSEDEEDMLDNVDKSIEKISELREKKDSKDDKKRSTNEGINSSIFMIEDKFKKDIDLAKKLTMILSKKRSNDFEDWVHVCWALNNISKNDELYRDFIKFSKRDPKFDMTVCKKKWDEASKWKKNHGKSGFGMPSLRMWACKDSPRKYTKIIRESVNELFEKADTGNDFDLAQLVYALYGYTYVCSDLDHNIWYQFKPELHKWIKIPKAYDLKIKISTEVAQEFANLVKVYAESYTAACMSDAKSGELSNHERKFKDTINIVKNLRKRPVKERIMHECADLFYDPHFEEKLDANRYLIGFNNGVYDLRTDSFRDGTPDDFVTKSTGYDYEEFHMGHKYVVDVLKCFRKAQTDKEMCNHVLTLYSSFLDGDINDERFDIFTGTGANGKSKMIELLFKALGDYAVILPPTIFTRKRGNSGQASPEIAELKGKRLVVLNEPEASEVLHVGLLKEMTGGDKIKARALYSDPIEFYPQCKFVMLCNILPNVDATDGGTWRRLKVTPWESQFVKVDENGKYNGRELGPNQFPRDNRLNSKFEKWKSALMWLLLKKYYIKYKKSGIPDPEKVNAKTMEYQQQNDSYLAFINENLEITKSNADKDLFRSIYDNFKEWYKEFYPGTRVPPSKDFKDYLNKDKSIRIKNNIIYGVKYKLPIDLNDDYDEDSD